MYLCTNTRNRISVLSIPWLEMHLTNYHVISHVKKSIKSAVHLLSYQLGIVTS